MNGLKRFEQGPRIIVARTIDDFAFIGRNRIKGAILKNPNIISEEDIEKLAAIAKPYLQFEPDEDLNWPESIMNTVGLMRAAFQKAKRAPIRFIQPRRNYAYPEDPHSHGFAVIADIFGSTTIGYTQDDLSRPFKFPNGSIVGFEKILHRAGEVKNPNSMANLERLNLIMG